MSEEKKIKMKIYILPLVGGKKKVGNLLLLVKISYPEKKKERNVCPSIPLVNLLVKRGFNFYKSKLRAVLVFDQINPVCTGLLQLFVSLQVSIAKSIDGMVLSFHSTMSAIAAGEFPSLGLTLNFGIENVTAAIYGGKKSLPNGCITLQKILDHS